MKKFSNSIMTIIFAITFFGASYSLGYKTGVNDSIEIIETEFDRAYDELSQNIYDLCVVVAGADAGCAGPQPLTGGSGK